MLFNDLRLPSLRSFHGGGCGKTKLMQLVAARTLRIFLQRVLLMAPYNQANRNLNVNANTLHSVIEMRIQSIVRTFAWHIKCDAMRNRIGHEPNACDRLDS